MAGLPPCFVAVLTFPVTPACDDTSYNRDATYIDDRRSGPSDWTRPRVAAAKDVHGDVHDTAAAQISDRVLQWLEEGTNAG
jgi:hypothetical protein